jgi:hypothetical protein
LENVKEKDYLGNPEVDGTKNFLVLINFIPRRMNPTRFSGQ